MGGEVVEEVEGVEGVEDRQQVPLVLLNVL
jgi:hypothetical protein